MLPLLHRPPPCPERSRQDTDQSPSVARRTCVGPYDLEGPERKNGPSKLAVLTPALTPLQIAVSKRSTAKRDPLRGKGSRGMGREGIEPSTLGLRGS